MPDSEFIVNVPAFAMAQARSLVTEHEGEDLIRQIAMTITNAIQMGRDEKTFKYTDYVVLPDGRLGYITNDEITVEVIGRQDEGTETVGVKVSELKHIP